MEIYIKKKLRDYLKLVWAIIFSWLYIPHFVTLLIIGKKKRRMILSDVEAMYTREYVKVQKHLGLLNLLHNNRYFRNLFYFRIGSILSLLIGWYRPGDRYFVISQTLKLGKGCLISHPFSTELNANEIGDNFDCRHCTTLGAKPNGRPSLGNNVYLGASVTIIGNVHIGNNVIVGAGSVVVKDIPDNAVVAGNPAKIIKYRSTYN